MLSDPVMEGSMKWHKDDAKGHTVGSRIKTLLGVEGRGSFQRVHKERMVDPANTWGHVENTHFPLNHCQPHQLIGFHRNYPVPEILNVVCNSCATGPSLAEEGKDQE